LVFANAGVGGPGLLAGRTGEDPDAVAELIAVSFAGVISTVAPLIPRFLQRGTGHIVLVGSIAGLAGLPAAPAYSAVKSAIHVYGDALAGSLSGTGVMVSVVKPGFIDTPGSRWINTPRPGLMSADMAATAILNRVLKGRSNVQFPILLGIATRIIGLLPPFVRKSVSDALLSRTVPSTSKDSNEVL
jgi:short-subunit dehydrogenase